VRSLRPYDTGPYIQLIGVAVRPSMKTHEWTLIRAYALLLTPLFRHADIMAAVAHLANAREDAPVVGTPEYMAPEAYELTYSDKVDIYAFGICLLVMLTQELPYLECANVAQIYRRVTAGTPPESLQRVPGGAARDLILVCLAGEPAKRPTAAGALEHVFFRECEGDDKEVIVVERPLEDEGPK
jgi:serine/threonine protein kinase